MPGKTLAELISEGDKNTIDRIHFRKSLKEINAFDKLDLEEKSYSPTLWHPFRRSRTIDGLHYTFTTCFKNDNPQFPVALLAYETGSNSDKVTLRLVVREESMAILPMLLAAKLDRINMPTSNPMTFLNLEDDSSDFNFIGDHMCPVYLIDGKQSKFGSLYFMQEHNQTIRLFREKDYHQPLVMARNSMLSLYKSVQLCGEDKSEQNEPIVEDISVSPPKLKNIY